MEIADLVVINKFDGEYKAVCRGLRRKIQSALSLTRPKHTDFSWHCPVELVSASDDFNVDSIWNTAVEFRETMGEDLLIQRRKR